MPDIEKLISKGIESGVLTYQEINAYLDENITPEDVDEIFNKLEIANINVVDERVRAAAAKKKIIQDIKSIPPPSLSSTDSIKMYFTTSLALF